VHLAVYPSAQSAEPRRQCLASKDCRPLSNAYPNNAYPRNMTRCGTPHRVIVASRRVFSLTAVGQTLSVGADPEYLPLSGTAKGKARLNAHARVTRRCAHAHLRARGRGEKKRKEEKEGEREGERNVTTTQRRKRRRRRR